MSVATDNNISVKEYRISKNKDMEMKIKKIWHFKLATVPVIVGALGMIRKGIDKHIQKKPGKYEMQ